MIINVQDIDGDQSLLTVQFQDPQEEESVPVFHSMLIRAGFDLLCRTRLVQLFDTGRTTTFVKGLVGQQIPFTDEPAFMSLTCGGGFEGECICDDT